MPAPQPEPALQPAPGTPPDVVCFAGVDWWYHNRAHSDVQLMRHIAMGAPGRAPRKVLLVNSIGMRMPRPGKSSLPFRRMARKLRSMTRGLKAPVPELPNFSVLTPVLLPFYGNARARAMNARIIRKQVLRACNRVGITAPPHVVATLPTAWDPLQGMRRASLLYNRSDKHSAFGEADTDVIGELERAMLFNSDRVLYSSRAFMESEVADAGKRAVFLDHGVDLNRFSGVRAEVPAELANLPRPILGFFGGLDDYIIDFELLEHVARAMPNASIVLIGDATLSLERLRELPNVHLLGFKDYEDIPAYGAAFDVGLMPWLDNDWIRHANPIKLKEYLALGLPIVTTPFPEGVHYAEHLRVGVTREGFVDAIRDALAEGVTSVEQTRRDDLLAACSWSARAGDLLDLADAAADASQKRRDSSDDVPSASSEVLTRRPAAQNVKVVRRTADESSSTGDAGAGQDADRSDSTPSKESN